MVGICCKYLLFNNCLKNKIESDKTGLRFRPTILHGYTAAQLKHPSSRRPSVGPKIFYYQLETPGLRKFWSSNELCIRGTSTPFVKCES